MVIPKRFKEASLDNFRTRTKVDKEIVAHLQTELKNNTIILGGVGIGKTHLAWALYRSKETEVEIKGELVKINNTVKITTIKEIVDDIRSGWKTGKSNIEDYKNIPILIVDELGVQYGSDSEKIELFEVFNYRYNEMLPTVAISNLNKEQIKIALGLRIYDRLFGGAKVFELYGESER